MKLRLLIAAAALAMTALVHAQTLQVQTGTSPVIEVQRLAPQLVAFAGGEVNFANLVNGLALGLPVTLTTPVGAGVTQVVNFTPVGTMSAVQIAQVLESARQSLIARGIATPSAQQLATALVGGTLPTALGNTPMNGLVSSSTALGTSTRSSTIYPNVAARSRASNAVATHLSGFSSGATSSSSPNSVTTVTGTDISRSTLKLSENWRGARQNAAIARIRPR